MKHTAPRPKHNYRVKIVFCSIHLQEVLYFCMCLHEALYVFAYTFVCIFS